MLYYILTSYSQINRLLKIKYDIWVCIELYETIYRQAVHFQSIFVVLTLNRHDITMVKIVLIEQKA
jgi:hypothetical protein